MERKFLTLIISASAFILAMLLGWGIADWREYFANSARAGLIVVVLSGAGVAWFTRIDLNPLRRGRSQLGHQSFVLVVLTLASLFLIWFLPFADRRQILSLGHGGMPRWIGLLLCGMGIAARLLALAKLGNQFSAYVTLQDGHELIQSGIYGVVRHPLYLSLLLAGPGFALVFDSLLVWPIVMAAVIFVAGRIREEEKLLKSEFGRSFEAYRARTWT